MSFAFGEGCQYKIRMKAVTRGLLLFAIGAAGCGTAHTVAHVVTAPVRMVHHGTDSQSPRPTSDVDVPGQPVAATPTPHPRVSQSQSKPNASPSPLPRAASNQPQFPVAKAVPGKPGLVYSPFDPKGGLIDVSGYASGSKVKDPDTQKIFVVP